MLFFTNRVMVYLGDHPDVGILTWGDIFPSWKFRLTRSCVVELRIRVVHVVMNELGHALVVTVTDLALHSVFVHGVCHAAMHTPSVCTTIMSQKWAEHFHRKYTETFKLMIRWWVVSCSSHNFDFFLCCCSSLFFSTLQSPLFPIIILLYFRNNWISLPVFLI